MGWRRRSGQWGRSGQEGRCRQGGGRGQKGMVEEGVDREGRARRAGGARGAVKMGAEATKASDGDGAGRRRGGHGPPADVVHVSAGRQTAAADCCASGAWQPCARGAAYCSAPMPPRQRAMRKPPRAARPSQLERPVAGRRTRTRRRPRWRPRPGLTSGRRWQGPRRCGALRQQGGGAEPGGRGRRRLRGARPGGASKGQQAPDTTAAGHRGQKVST